MLNGAMGWLSSGGHSTWCTVMAVTDPDKGGDAARNRVGEARGLRHRQGSRRGDVLTSTGMTIGTMQYTSPEVIEGEQVDNRSDVYSLGCSAHLTKTVPLMSEVAPHLPQPMDAVFAQALAKRPADRFQSCAEFITALKAAATEVRDPAFLPTMAAVALPNRRAVEPHAPTMLRTNGEKTASARKSQLGRLAPGCKFPTPLRPIRPLSTSRTPWGSGSATRWRTRIWLAAMRSRSKRNRRRLKTRSSPSPVRHTALSYSRFRSGGGR